MTEEIHQKWGGRNEKWRGLEIKQRTQNKNTSEVHTWRISFLT